MPFVKILFVQVALYCISPSHAIILNQSPTRRCELISKIIAGIVGQLIPVLSRLLANVEPSPSHRPPVKICTLLGGHMLERKTNGAVGFDVCLRAIVSAREMDPDNPNLRKTLFDFEKIPDDPLIARHIAVVDDKLVYRMDPNESVLVGIGFVAEMQFPMFMWVTPRSGLASKWNVSVTNAPGTVDPDYRGEAGVVVHNRNNGPFDLELGLRIAQVIFQEAIIPEFLQVATFEDLGQTQRGAGGFGSTGLIG